MRGSAPVGVPKDCLNLAALLDTSDCLIGSGFVGASALTNLSCNALVCSGLAVVILCRVLAASLLGAPGSPNLIVFTGPPFVVSPKGTLRGALLDGSGVTSTPAAAA